MSWNGRRFRAARCGLPYTRQGLVWFTAQCCRDMPADVQELIRGACQRAGGCNAGALFEYVTTDRPMHAILREYHIASETTLYRAIGRWYVEVDRALRGQGKREE